MLWRASAVALVAAAFLWVGSASALALDVSVLESPYSAKGDGTTNDRASIQKAIDAVATAGGGKVTLPSGHTYLSGNLVLKSKVTFNLESGAVLKQSQSPSDYSPEPHKGREIPGGAQFETYMDQNYPLIYAGKATEVTVTGGGKIQLTRNGSDENSVLVHGIGFFETSHYVISNITIDGASAYNVTVRATEWGEIKNVTTTNPATLNSDGISMMNSSHLEVHNNNLTTEDDGIYVWASYKDPRKSAWWNSDTPRRSTYINVYENNVNNVSVNGSHGFCFINWTAAAEDQSEVEIGWINVHDNVFKASYPVAALNEDKYHSGSKTPSKFLTFKNNTLTVVDGSEKGGVKGATVQGLEHMATADFTGDLSLYNFGVAKKSDGYIYNANFDGTESNVFKAQHGTSFWSTEGEASAPDTAVGQPAEHYGQIAGFDKGYAGIYQGAYLEPGTYKFSAMTQSSGASVRLFAIRASNLEVMKSTTITNTSWESKSITFTVTVAGNYRLGIDNVGAGSSASSFGRIDSTKLE